MQTNKNLVACVGTESSYFFTGGSTIPGDLPSWLHITHIEVLAIVVGTLIVVDDDAVVGEYEYDLINYSITITVNASCFEEFNNCCEPQYNIAWFNPKSGWQNYPFTGTYSKEIRQEGTSQRFVSGREQRYAERGSVYDGMICNTGDIPLAHADMLDTLKNSIQAYLYNEETEQFDIPIILDDGSYVKYKSTEKYWNVAIRFKFSERRTIQTQ